MPDLPLSGDVSQIINPWKAFFRTVGSQFGFVNINLARTPAPDLEEHILADVGSYGRQLGRIGDALAVLLRHVEQDKLSEDERAAIEAFRVQHREIERIKARYYRD